MSTTFAQAAKSQPARTQNGMAALSSTSSPVVDMFYKIGAMRGQNITNVFSAAFAENRELALRVAQWARDIREGAGERKIFRDILNYLEASSFKDEAKLLMNKIPLLGRWDDLLVVQEPELRAYAFSMIEKALKDNNGLCAKWMPRKGPNAVALRTYLGLSPKAYRKLLVNLTTVVETKMCAKDWENINFSHVPSVASARYKKAFLKNAGDTYRKYLEELAKPDTDPTKDKTVKVNAGAVYPYDVIKTALSGDRSAKQLILSQWEALPNYVGDAPILAMVDVSGSMAMPITNTLTALHIALSVGLYVAEKNTGPFKNTFLTFSSSPELYSMSGDILQKLDQMKSSNWGMSTNLHAAMDKVLETGILGNVLDKDMPKILLILSDMQFNACARFDDTAMKMIQRKYESAGYTMPQIVFWNIHDKGTVPVKMDTSGVALVSGFSPSIMKSILSGKGFTPSEIMMETIMNPRYDM